MNADEEEELDYNPETEEEEEEEEEEDMPEPPAETDDEEEPSTPSGVEEEEPSTPSTPSGVEGAEPLAEPLEEEPSTPSTPSGVEGAEPLAEPLAYENVDDFSENFNSDTDYEKYKLPIKHDEIMNNTTDYMAQSRGDNGTKSKALIAGTDKIFVGLNLYEADLTSFNFDKCVFISCIFMMANMADMTMRSAVFYNCNFAGAQMKETNLSNSFIYNCTFNGATCIDANFSYVFSDYWMDDSESKYPGIKIWPFIQNTKLPQLSAEQPNNIMTEAILINANFNYAILVNCQFDQANLDYVYMRGANLTKASFIEVVLKEADFTNTTCIDAIFSQAKGRQICFNNANLTYAICQKADFRHGDFRRSILTGADFSDCKLDKAILQNCNATTINLMGAIMRECIIRDTLFFTEGSLPTFMNFVNLTGSIFIKCNLQGVTIESANCCDVQFIDSNLTSTNLESTNLHKSSFENCNLSGLNVNLAYVDDEMKTNFVAAGIDVNNLASVAPDQLIACARPSEAAPDFNNTDETETDPLFMAEGQAGQEGQAEEGEAEGQEEQAEGENSYLNIGDSVKIINLTEAERPLYENKVFTIIHAPAADVEFIYTDRFLRRNRLESDYDIEINDTTGIAYQTTGEGEAFYFIKNPEVGVEPILMPQSKLVIVNEQGQQLRRALFQSSESSVGEEEPSIESDDFDWNVEPERLPREEAIVNVEDVFTDADGNRMRVPIPLDITVVRHINKLMQPDSVARGMPLGDLMTNEMFWPANLPNSLRYMNFKEVNFNGVFFTGLDLTGTNFYGAQLEDANFVGATLTDVNFQWADLVGVDFTDAKMEGGDYAAGGLLEGATIINCNFTNTILAEEPYNYDEKTVIMPYDPIYTDPDDLILPAETPPKVNINGLGIVVKEEEGGAETKQLIKPLLQDNPGDYIVLRVINRSNKANYKDYIVDLPYLESKIADNSLVVYPCKKPFNVPGPSHPNVDRGERSYHDINRPILNLQKIIPQRIWVDYGVFKDALMEAVDESHSLVFFVGDNPETVPTFVSHAVLNGAGWVSEYHCNSGAERETLWYVKTIENEEGEVQVEEVEAEVEEPLEYEEPGYGVEGAEPLEYGVEGAEPLEYGVEGAEPLAEPLGDWVDPYADASSSESSNAEPASAEVNIPYNPIVPVVEIPITAALQMATATGNIVRNNMVLPSEVPIAPQLAPEIPTTTLVLGVVNGAGTTTKNYLIKFNELVEAFKTKDADYYPCEVANPVSKERCDVTRRLINIGKIIKQKIFIDKKQFIELFADRKTVRKQRSYLLQFNEASEKVPAVLKVKTSSGLNNVEKAVVVWSLQKWPNDLPEQVVPDEPLVQYNPAEEYPIGAIVSFDRFNDERQPQPLNYTIIETPTDIDQQVLVPETDFTSEGRRSYQEYGIPVQYLNDADFEVNANKQIFKNGMRYYVLDIPGINIPGMEFPLLAPHNQLTLVSTPAVGGGKPDNKRTLRQHRYPKGHHHTLRRHFQRPTKKNY
jgi:uncharacterized protein YjbI with pentapeptide repeats